MDHGEKFWHKQSYEYQINAIGLELDRLVNLWGKTPQNVNLLMNRCIKYTKFSINDPKNEPVKDELLRILDVEVKYKANPEEKKLEDELLVFFGCKKSEDDKENDEDNNIFDLIFRLLDEKTPDSVISVIRYDEEDNPIDMKTGTFQEVFSSIPNPCEYYYRVAILDQNTVRKRIQDVHFGVKTSCIGGLEFSISETLNRYLNKQVSHYCKGGKENFFYLLSKVQLYTSKMDSLSKNTKDELEKELNKLISNFPELEAVNDLNVYKGISGIYVMVLDKYHVLYIGQANDIKRRIMRHWLNADYFRGTGIDLFKAYDTTRIYALKCEKNKINRIEYQMTQLINNQYSLNILTGGDIDYHVDNNLPIIQMDESEIEKIGIFDIFDQVASFADDFIVRQ